MKLLKKISIYFILFSAIVFVLGSISTYLVLQELISEEVHETLESEKKNILEELEMTGLPGAQLKTGKLEISRIPDSVFISETFKDTLLFVPEEHEPVPFSQLVFSARVQHGNYRITLRSSLIEKDDVVLGITVMMMVIFITMILLLNGINYWSDRRLWKPFYRALDKLKTFQLNSRQGLVLPAEGIDEFNQLNRALNTMTAKLQDDYRSLKEFSENAAHEMQTPLAVIRSKLDVLIQDQSLSEAQMQTIQALYQAVNRLARLNQSLNLLTKIENREFSQKQAVDFNALIDEQLLNLEELIHMNQLRIQRHYTDQFVLEFNPLMAETLVSNLLVNAVKHNLPQGFIHIKTTKEAIAITNSGPPLQSDPQELFERFKKDSPVPDSPGLGLSIVQSICRQNGLGIEYRYDGGKHIIQIENIET